MHAPPWMRRAVVASNYDGGVVQAWHLPRECQQISLAAELGLHRGAG